MSEMKDKRRWRKTTQQPNINLWSSFCWWSWFNKLLNLPSILGSLGSLLVNKVTMLDRLPSGLLVDESFWKKRQQSKSWMERQASMSFFLRLECALLEPDFSFSDWALRKRLPCLNCPSSQRMASRACFESFFISSSWSITEESDSKICVWEWNRTGLLARHFLPTRGMMNMNFFILERSWTSLRLRQRTDASGIK